MFWSFDGIRPQEEGDKEQGYNHQFVPTVRGGGGLNRALRNEKLLSPLFPIGVGGRLQMTGVLLFESMVVANGTYLQSPWSTCLHGIF